MTWIYRGKVQISNGICGLNAPCNKDTVQIIGTVSVIDIVSSKHNTSSMERMKIFVVGSGKLANAILTSNLSFQSCEILKWKTQYQTLNEKAIIVHAGSGRQLKECFEFCVRTKSLFIELSTGLETEKMRPNFPLIICPNTSILLLKTLNIIKVNGRYFESYKI